MRAVPLGPSVELPIGPRKGGTHAGGAPVPSVATGAPYEARKRCAGCGGGAHTGGATGVSLWSSQSMEPRSAVLGGGRRMLAVPL
eukprot:103865-Pyramimonas_sp.AAC.1